MDPDTIPLDILRDRNLSVLESIVEYLKNKGLSFHEIAILLNRDERNIWTVYNRAKKKRHKFLQNKKIKKGNKICLYGKG
jgi:hypothetical protein